MIQKDLYFVTSQKRREREKWMLSDVIIKISRYLLERCIIIYKILTRLSRYSRHRFSIHFYGICNSPLPVKEVVYTYWHVRILGYLSVEKVSHNPWCPSTGLLDLRSGRGGDCHNDSDESW